MQAYQRDGESLADRWTEQETKLQPARGTYYLAEGVEQLAAAVFVRAALDYAKPPPRKGHRCEETVAEDRGAVIKELRLRGGPCHYLWGDLAAVDGGVFAGLLQTNPKVRNLRMPTGGNGTGRARK